jgi:catechol 2,3-dioxygenase-like lactoylglutathione lyase family enzyme
MPPERCAESDAVTVRAVGINHIALEVDDLDAALGWYARWFEFRLRGRRETMAWIDLGDQFVALSLTPGGTRSPDGDRHIGLVVDDKEALRAELLAAGEDVAGAGSLRLRDPSGNQLEIVDYRDVQFSKTDAVLVGMGLQGLEKSEQARAEMRAKGLIA